MEVNSVVDNKLKNIAWIVYVLQAISGFLGFTFIVAVIINYVKRSEVKGTWLESHFTWQIRTFWFSALFFFVPGTFVLAEDPNTLLTRLIYVISYVVCCVWVIALIYRICKGMIRLTANKPI
jgi:uncharacterized membrane protein